MIDLSGERYGELVVLRFGETREQQGRRRHFWICRCSCGAEVTANADTLRAGRKRSCGCATSRLKSKGNLKHGWYGTPTYSSWAAMKSRCLDKKSPSYRKYGERGVSVCESWMDFDNFRSDMGERPSRRHSIDRINGEGNYEPGNCRWATPTEQARNLKTNRILQANGESRCISEWASIVGIGCATISKRLRLGWSAHDAIFKPVRKMTMLGGGKGGESRRSSEPVESGDDTDAPF